MLRVGRWTGAVLLAWCAGAASGAAAEATTVIVVRHAEKETNRGDDPPLTAAGQARAQELARVLTASGVGAVYDTQYQRTQATCAPTAARAGVTAVHWTAADAAGLAKEIKDKRAGQTVLVCAHSNTIPTILHALGGPAIDELPDQAFDDLFVVALGGDGSARVTRLKYGAP